MFQELTQKGAITIPEAWHMQHNSDSDSDIPYIKYFTVIVPHSKLHSGLVPNKEITLLEDLTFELRIMNHPVDVKKIGLSEARVRNKREMEEVLKKVNSLAVCRGSQVPASAKPTDCCYKEYSCIMRHKNCSLIIEEGRQCSWCKKLSCTISRKNQHPPRREADATTGLSLSSKEKKVFDAMTKKIAQLEEEIKKKDITLQDLSQKLGAMKKEMSEIETKSFEKILSDRNLSENEKLSIREIFSCSKAKSRKGRRYTDDWIIMCLMFHLRSPAGYRFVKDNKVLPLPSISSIRL